MRFEHMTDGVRRAGCLLNRICVPTLVRLYDRADSEIFLRNHPDEPRGPLLLLSFDGTDVPPERTRRSISEPGIRATIDAGRALVGASQRCRR